MILIIAPPKQDKTEGCMFCWSMKDQKLIFNINMGNLENVWITNSMNSPDCTMNDLLLNYHKNNGMLNTAYALLSLVSQCPWISNGQTNHLESYWILPYRRYTYYM